MNTEMEPAAKTPWHIWVMGLVGLLWHGGGGGSNYISVKTATPEFYQQQADALGTSAEIVTTYMESYPLWANIAYGVAVWGAVLGSLLLLFRNRYAVLCFALSLVAYLVNVVHQLVRPIEGVEAMGFYWGFSAFIGVTIAAFWFYAKKMRDAGVLR